jgi:hypothetical protein
VLIIVLKIVVGDAKAANLTAALMWVIPDYHNLQLTMNRSLNKSILITPNKLKLYIVPIISVFISTFASST